MSLLQNSNAIETGGYSINNSLRFRSSSSAYLNRTPASAGNRQTWTWSAWVKRGALGNLYGLFGAKQDSSNWFQFYFESDDTLYVAASAMVLKTTQVFRDPSSWYHVVLAMDTTQATASNRLKLYINGSQVTSFSSTTYPVLNGNYMINSTSPQTIGTITSSASATTYPFDGYLAEVNFIDGQALTPSSFGATDVLTGVWQPKKYTGTYGTNGFYLQFSNIATTSGSNAGLGKDFSGNGNYWNTNNISVTSGTTYDAMIDSPTVTTSGTQPVGNYAVLNPVYKSYSQPTFSNANLTIAPNAATYQNASSTINVTSGKWYAEFTTNGTPNSANMVGISSLSELNTLVTTASYVGSSSTGYSFQFGVPNKINNGVTTSYGSIPSSGGVIMMAFDLDNGKIWWGLNGTWFSSGDPAAGTNAAFTGITGSNGYSVVTTAYSGGLTSLSHNFGQRPFAYTPPTGYKALCTTNLPDSTIVKGNQYMDATLYTGTSANQTITNAGGFQPDLVWCKARNSAYPSVLMNVIAGANQYLISSSTNAEGTFATGLTSFNSNGFSLGADTTSGAWNYTGVTYVAWQWDAGSSTVTNTSGTISSQVRANPTAGVSVVTYTGTGANATVGHGLGVAPKMIIVKNRSDGTTNWAVYHVSTGANGVLFLNATNAVTTVSGKWGTPNSTTFGVNTADDVNKSSSNLVAYCFSEISGFSKFGSYTGNGSADGPFIFTGFRPKYVMIKRSSNVADWFVYDSVRNTYNVCNLYLEPNASAAEGTATSFDLVSNGFKLRDSLASFNSNGDTFIYAAFAESPFKVSLAR